MTPEQVTRLWPVLQAWKDNQPIERRTCDNNTQWGPWTEVPRTADVIFDHPQYQFRVKTFPRRFYVLVEVGSNPPVVLDTVPFVGPQILVGAPPLPEHAEGTEWIPVVQTSFDGP